MDLRHHPTRLSIQLTGHENVDRNRRDAIGSSPPSLAMLKLVCDVGIIFRGRIITPQRGSTRQGVVNTSLKA
jgi:hypothetical protein